LDIGDWIFHVGDRHLLRFHPAYDIILLGISPEDYAWLKLDESAFEFWDNESEVIYEQSCNC